MARAPQTNVVPIEAATRSGRVKTMSGVTSAGPIQTFDASAILGGGDGGHGGWRQSVETRLSELRADMRNLLIAGGVIALALLAAGWGSYTSAMGQLKEMAVTQQQIAGKIETLDAKVAGRLDLMEQRLSDKSQASPPTRKP